MPDDPEFYPELRCHMAPLRYGSAPMADCTCRICTWADARSWNDTTLALARGPIKPGTPEWRALLETAAWLPTSS